MIEEEKKKENGELRNEKSARESHFEKREANKSAMKKIGRRR